MERKTERYASASEIDETVGQIRGKSPDEVLAAMSQASLSRCVGMASIACVILLGVLTVVPMILFPASDTKAATQAAAPAKPEDKPATPPADAKAATAEKKTEGDQKPSADAVKKLGLDETKQSDPKKNPLDNVDDLLKDIK
jgi:cytoskeletal protein RodZ